MSPILKNKEQRDSLLLVGMVILTAAFLFYIMVPTSGTDSPPDSGGKRLNSSSTAGSAGDPIQEESGYSAILIKLLEQAFLTLTAEDIPEPSYRGSELERHVDRVEVLGRTNAGRETLQAWREDSRRLGLFELGDPKILNLPTFLDKEVRFHLYLALLFLKLRTPEGISQLRSASEFRMLRLLDAPVFQLVNWELRRDAEALPAMVVFRFWLERRSLYPDVSQGVELSRRLNRFSDLSPGRWVSKLIRLIDYSMETRLFTIEWVEDDGIFGTDRGVFRQVKFPVHKFLGQWYTHLPTGGEKSDEWLSSLSDSDPGDIELVAFKIVNTEFSGPALIPECVFYNPLGSGFLVIFTSSLQKREFPVTDPLVKIVRHRCERQHRGDRKLMLNAAGLESKKNHEKQLKLFGRFLKRLGSL